MKMQTIDAAIAEARRFLQRAEELKQAEDKDSKLYCPGTKPRQTGALRRASMDLTRALADMRQGR